MPQAASLHCMYMLMQIKNKKERKKKSNKWLIDIMMQADFPPYAILSYKYVCVVSSLLNKVQPFAPAAPRATIKPSEARILRAPQVHNRAAFA